MCFFLVWVGFFDLFGKYLVLNAVDFCLFGGWVGCIKCKGAKVSIEYDRILHVNICETVQVSSLEHIFILLTVQKSQTTKWIYQTFSIMG